MATGWAELAAEVRHELAEGWRSRQWVLRPESLQLELTSACDARCIHCPRQEMDRAVAAMPLPLFQRIIEQAAELKVPRIVPNGYGEILVLKNAAAYLEFIRRQRHQFDISINTNGFRLTDEKINLFIDHTVKLLNVNIDGATAATAEAVRPRLKFDEIERNLHRFLEIRSRRGAKYPTLLVGMVVFEVNRHETEAFVARWQGVADRISLNGYSGRLDSLRWKGEGDTSIQRCVLPFRDLNIWSNGQAVLCCNDWNAKHVVGDLNRQTLTEVWRGTVMTEARRLHRERKGAQIPVCAQCNQWIPPGALVRLKA